MNAIGFQLRKSDTEELALSPNKSHCMWSMVVEANYMILKAG